MNTLERFVPDILGYMEKLDFYLLINKPNLWSSKAHKFLFYSIFSSIAVLMLYKIGILTNLNFIGFYFFVFSGFWAYNLYKNLPKNLIQKQFNIQSALIIFFAIMCIFLNHFIIENFGAKVDHVSVGENIIKNKKFVISQYLTFGTPIVLTIIYLGSFLRFNQLIFWIVIFYTVVMFSFMFLNSIEEHAPEYDKLSFFKGYLIISTIGAFVCKYFFPRFKILNIIFFTFLFSCLPIISILSATYFGIHSWSGNLIGIAVFLVLINLLSYLFFLKDFYLPKLN